MVIFYTNSLYQNIDEILNSKTSRYPNVQTLQTDIQMSKLTNANYLIN